MHSTAGQRTHWWLAGTQNALHIFQVAARLVVRWRVLGGRAPPSGAPQPAFLPPAWCAKDARDDACTSARVYLQPRLLRLAKMLRASGTPSLRRSVRRAIAGAPDHEHPPIGSKNVNSLNFNPPGARAQVAGAPTAGRLAARCGGIHLRPRIEPLTHSHTP